MLPTVIIPAYNEHKVIGKLLSSLHSGVTNKCFQVIVACNGTTDGSVEFIRARFPMVTCLNIEKASKTNALNVAENLNSGFPHIFVDADVIIGTSDVENIINYISQLQDAALVVPRGRINTKESSFCVRTFYSAWMKTVFYLDYGFGAGVYALNKQARSRFELFPEVIADDGFIREVVQPEQLHICEMAESQIEAPRSLADLLNIKIRSKLGNQQLVYLGLIQNTKYFPKRFLGKINLLEFFVYIAVSYLAKRGAKQRLNTMDKYLWQRDESSRT